MNTATDVKEFIPPAAANALTSHFIQVPQITLPSSVVPGGNTVPAFKVAQYHCSKGADGLAAVSPDAMPWVNITYFGAIEACDAVNRPLLRELQAVAIAHDIASVDINWTGGQVGVGKIYQGLHKGAVDEAQPGDFVSDDPEERSWHELSNGERIYHFAGNLYSHIFDDLQGDDRGLIAKPFAASSPSIAVAPYPSMEKGMGWRPRAGADWSGNALVRGGYWNDEDNAGVFRLRNVRPADARDLVGFRCTLPE